MQYSAIIDKFATKKILVIGDIILDHYIYGSSHRVSPEAPVPVVQFEEEFYTAGGAANVAVNLASLNANVYIAGRTGKDKYAEILLDKLAPLEINTISLLRIPGYNTPIKTRVISDGQQIVRLDRERTEKISENEEKKLLDKISLVINSYEPDAIIVSDYNKGLFSGLILDHLFSMSKQKRITVLVDPKSSDFGKYKGADIITPNREEAETVYGNKLLEDSDIQNAIRCITDITGSKQIFITRGKKGTSYLGKEGDVITIPAKAREVYDVTGAGDTFISTLTLGISSGCSDEDAVHIANTAAGIVVGRTGTSSVHAGELLAALHSQEKQKLISPEQLETVVNTIKSRGKKIVFTNGCFDLFHAGHLGLLEESSRLGDVLIVAINSDESVKKLKGPERPVISEIERTSILSAISCVDYVTVFNEPTPFELIKKIRPSVITKGGDYKPEDVVGRNIVEKYGGRVEIIPVTMDISTSGILNRIKNSR